MLRRRLFRLYEYGVTIESSTTNDVRHLRNDCIVTRRPEWRRSLAYTQTHACSILYPTVTSYERSRLARLVAHARFRDPGSLPDRDAGAAVHASQRAELSGHRGAAEPGGAQGTGGPARATGVGPDAPRPDADLRATDRGRVDRGGVQ